MSKTEKITSILHIISTIFMGISVIYGAIQINKTSEIINLRTKAHNENLEWNRKIETKKIMNSTSLSDTRNKLNSAFDCANRTKAIPLDEINEKIKEDKGVQIHIHNLLNHYELLASGIFMKIYSEEMVKKSLSSVMKNNYMRFRDYINFRRNSFDKELWIEYEMLLDKWMLDGLK